MSKNKPQILEGSRAIALTVKNIKPAVVSAYPITPQTHIVEDLAKFKAAGEADYELLRAESEFAAASIVLGASASGVRTYTSTSSQGLLLMAEVVYNIGGLQLPVVITCANRAVGAPINIWNDQQDIMSVRDAGWLSFFAEDHQEAVYQHILAYKIAEEISIPAFVNVDGFVLTHSYGEVYIPEEKEIKKFLPDYNPKKNSYLDIDNPRTLGPLVTPADYQEMRLKLHKKIINSKKLIKSEWFKLKKIFDKNADYQLLAMNNGLVEYYGPAKVKIIIISIGSVIGTIKDAVDEENEKSASSHIKVGVIKIRTFRPFPDEEILSIIKKTGAKKIITLEKSISLGAKGILETEIKSSLCGKINIAVKSIIEGLGGKDITKEMIKKILK